MGFPPRASFDVASATDIPNTTFFPAGGTVDRDWNYGGLTVTFRPGFARPKLGINQWIDSAQKILWVDVLPSAKNGRALRSDYAGYTVRLKNMPDTIPAVGSVLTSIGPLPAGSPAFANTLWQGLQSLNSQLAGTSQAASAAASSADTAAKAATAPKASGDSTNTLLIVAGVGLALLLLWKK